MGGVCSLACWAGEPKKPALQVPGHMMGLMAWGQMVNVSSRRTQPAEGAVARERRKKQGLKLHFINATQGCLSWGWPWV